MEQDDKKMERKKKSNIDYLDGKVYKLIDTVNGHYYFGSTCQSLAKRLYLHKQLAKRKPETKVYKYFNSVGWDNVKIILVDDQTPFENKDQLNRAENEHIEANFDNPKCLNSNKAWTGIDTRDRRHYDKEYKGKHANIIRQRNKEYYANNKDRCCERSRRYFKANADQMLHKQAQMRHCETCGSNVTTHHFARHCRSIKHQQALQKANTI